MYEDILKGEKHGIKETVKKLVSKHIECAG